MVESRSDRQRCHSATGSRHHTNHVTARQMTLTLYEDQAMSSATTRSRRLTTSTAAQWIQQTLANQLSVTRTVIACRSSMPPVWWYTAPWRLETPAGAVNHAAKMLARPPGRLYHRLCLGIVTGHHEDHPDTPSHRLPTRQHHRRLSAPSPSTTRSRSPSSATTSIQHR